MGQEHYQLDDLTPRYRPLLDGRAVQKRKILTAMAREGRPLRIVEIAKVARLGQQNKTSAQVSRLTHEGLLTRGEDRRYSFKDSNLLAYLRARSGYLN